MGITNIEWVATRHSDGSFSPGYSFNPWRGCTKVSAGCTFCYADELSKRNPATLGIWGDNGTRVLASDAMWREPLKWDREAEKSGIRPRVFCASLADVFENWDGPILDSQGRRMLVSYGDGGKHIAYEYQGNGPKGLDWTELTLNDVRRRLFDLIDQTQNLDWLLLTKRPENIRRMWPDEKKPWRATGRWHRDNVWIGTTVENQEQADKRIPELLKCRDLSPVLFLSCEPLLGPVDLTRIENGNVLQKWTCRHESHDILQPIEYCKSSVGHDRVIDWVICGSESGPKRRLMQLEWAESLRQQCNNAGVAFFMKQMEVDSKVTTDVSRFPVEMQSQVFPRIS